MFEMIPDISFFDTETKIGKLFDKNVGQKKIRLKIDKLPVLEELWIFDVIGRCAGKRFYSSLRLLAEG